MRKTKTMLMAAGLGFVAVAALAAAPPTPRLSDGRPDFSGTWENGGGIDNLRPVTREDGAFCVSGCTPPPGSAANPRPAPDRPKYRPEHQQRVDELKAQQVKFDPVLRCQPPGLPRIGPPDKIIQNSRELVFLYEDVSGPFFRIVPLDRAVQRIDDSESYLGDAYGRWEGDTLVVETTNFNALTWLTDDGSFHSTDLKVTERFTRTGNEILWEATADDPAVLAEPWKVRPRRMLPAEKELSEPAPCVEQDLEHMVDDSFHSNPR